MTLPSLAPTALLGFVLMTMGVLTLSLAFAARRTAPPGDVARWRLFTGPVMIIAGMVMIATSLPIFAF